MEVTIRTRLAIRSDGLPLAASAERDASPQISDSSRGAMLAYRLSAEAISACTTGVFRIR